MAKKKTNKLKRRDPILDLESAVQETPIAEFESTITFEKSITESSPNSDPTPRRLRTSPYTDFSVALYIGPDEIAHYIPRYLLPPPWNNIHQKERLCFSDVEMETGHTFVHYLHTGAYDTLDTDVGSSTLEPRIELKRAFLVYIMASNHGLLGLRQLAMRKIEHHAARLDISETLEATKEDFVRLKPGSWFHRYLKKKAKAAFEGDHTVFRKEAFLEILDNAALGKFMMRCAMRGLRRRRL